MEQQYNPGSVSTDNHQPKSSLWQHMKHFGRNREEQIEKNQAAIELIRSWREEKLDAEELKLARDTWELVKTLIDENRSRKLFS